MLAGRAEIISNLKCVRLCYKVLSILKALTPIQFLCCSYTRPVSCFKSLLGEVNRRFCLIFFSFFVCFLCECVLLYTLKKCSVCRIIALVIERTELPIELNCPFWVICFFPLSLWMVLPMGGRQTCWKCQPISGTDPFEVLQKGPLWEADISYMIITKSK